MVSIIKLSMEITVEYLQPFNHFFEVYVSSLSVMKQLFGVSHLEAVGGIKG
jgi:hypothetical protein